MTQETYTNCEECKDKELYFCTDCNMKHSKSDLYKSTIDGDYYCEACKDEKLYFCTRCDEEYDESDLYKSTINDNYYCEDCIDEELYFCTSCGEEYNESDLYQSTIDSDYYCEDCKDEKLYFCADCGEEYDESDLYKSTIDGNYYCEDCKDEELYFCANCDAEIPKYSHQSEYYSGLICAHCWNNLSTCHSCNTECLTEDMVYDEYLSQHYCEDCHEEHTQPMSSYEYLENISKYGILDYSKKLKFPEAYNSLGIELEMSYANTTRFPDIVQTLKELKHGFFCKHDSSICGDNDLEVIFDPIEINDLENFLTNIRPVLHTLRSLGCCGHDAINASCGIHVHLSRNIKNTCYKELNADNIWQFFVQNRTNIISLSRRSDKKIDQWCKFPSRLDEIDHHTRYNAVNTEPDQTIEIRIFRSTLLHSSFCNCLRFCKYLLETQINNQKYSWPNLSEKYPEIIDYISSRS